MVNSSNMHHRSTSTRESDVEESSVSTVSTVSATATSKARSTHQQQQQRLKAQQRWWGPRIAGIGIVLVLMYTVFMISHVLGVGVVVGDGVVGDGDVHGDVDIGVGAGAGVGVHGVDGVVNPPQSPSQNQNEQEQEVSIVRQQRHNVRRQVDAMQAAAQQQRQENVQRQQHQLQQQQQQEQLQRQQQRLQQQQDQELLGRIDDMGPNECEYDGHCPVRHTCAAAAVEGEGADGVPRSRSRSSSRTRGVCQPLESKGRYDLYLDDNPTATNSCVAACRTELELDEHFYQESWPDEALYEIVPASKGRPRGCLYIYVREPEESDGGGGDGGGDRWKAMQDADDNNNNNNGTEWKEVPPSIRNWTEHRFRHVVRVDPVNEVRNDDAWMAYCHNTCVTDVDCATTTASTTTTTPPRRPPPPPFTCQLGACMRNKDYWNPNNGNAKDVNGLDVDQKPEMVIVTGATSAYLRGLTNLCASLRYWAPHHRVVVYNLGGMSTHQMLTIAGWSNVAAVEWETGIPAHYPQHVRTDPAYAWKPIIVNETLHKYKSIFWMDAGSTVAGPITPIEEIVQKTGMVLVKGQDLDMKLRSFPDTYDWFNVSKEKFVAGPHFSGNTQAFLLPSRYVESIVIPDAACAMDPNCITPPGALLENHRFDQTTISILAYMPKVRAPHYTEYLASSKKQLNADLRQSSFKMIWTTRQTVDFFTKWETSSDAPLRSERSSQLSRFFMPRD